MTMQPFLIEVPEASVEEIAPELFAGITTQAVNTPEMLGPVIEAIQTADTIAIDCETTGLDYMRDQLHGVSIGVKDAEWYICGNALYTFLPQLSELCKDPEKLWVGHNIKFDLHFLAPKGFTPARIADTMVAQWLVDENYELALKSLAQTRLGYTDLPEFSDLIKAVKKALKKKRMAEVTVFDIPENALADYAARDARLTYDLWLLLQYDLHTEGMEELFWNVEMPFVWLLLDVENNGMYIDPVGLAELDKELTEGLETALKTWNELSGGEVNPNSPVQLGTLFFETLKLPTQGKTKKGQASVDDLTLQRLEGLDTTGTVKALRELRKYEKLKSTYITFLTDKTVENRIHGSFNPTGAATGRLSSSDPNLQNIPSKGKLGKAIKKVFAAPPGKKLVDIDYSQIELRTMASDANEPNFIKVFEEDGDPHQLTADLAGVERSVGKTLNFAWAYGAGPRRLADTIEKNGAPRPKETDTRAWLDSFNKAYPTLVKYKSQVIRRTRELGYVPTFAGRKRRLPDINSPVEGIRGGAERQAVNARIQGSAADMLKWAMLELRPYLEWYGAKMIATVHDELLFEVDEDLAEDFGKYAQEVMESIKEKFNLRVKVIAEPGVGSSWAEAKG